MPPDYTSLDLLELDEIIDSYDISTDPILGRYFTPIEEILWSMIEHYGEGKNNFGHQMSNHLRRTSLDGMKFLTEGLGFSQRAGRNFHAANLFHDLGKIHAKFDPGIWSLPNRPTEEQRAEKRKHAKRGPLILNAAIANAPKELKQHPHIAIVIPAIQLFHHERADGKGYFGKNYDKIGKVIKTTAIIDTKDGDMIRRGHHDFHRDEKHALLRMKGNPEYDTKGKYIGAFDDLLDTYIRYREKESGQKIL